MKIELVRLIKKEKLSEEIFAFDIKSKTIARNAKPGQFIQIRVNESFDPFLRRPLSFASVKNDAFRVVFKVRGKGTKILSRYEVGEDLDVIGPLGNPIDLREIEQVILIGGGVGIAPLYFLAQKIRQQHHLKILLGAKTRNELIMLEDFQKISNNVAVATEDGSIGKKGRITDLLDNREFKNQNSKIFACGPTPMLHALKKKLPTLTVYGFLEERMGCGTGICFSCAIKRKARGYLRVCQEGPVVNLSEIEI